MSTDKRPGMAVNEEEIERHVRETREQASRAHYPERSTPLHGKAEPPMTKGHANDPDQSEEANKEEKERKADTKQE
jgi:hypothetical protein